ncbi:MAG: LacI family DNA-binding transcriptional regulator [Terracidiphilus sp.]|nr:LacI family DNA-binding transcriptional regulator [Terracidiphilus sp.]
MMATLSDVAKIAGVGVMSVSRVVNGTRKVSPAVERKVREAIERIGYEPNEAARILKGQRGHIIGLIVPDLADPFFATCANVIQETVRDAGYLTLMAASAHREDIERKQTEIMVRRQIAGLLVVPCGSQNQHFLEAQNAGMPIVAFDRPLENLKADSLVVDNRQASMRAVEHLIEHGHRNILCVADDYRIFTRSQRVSGYSQAMRRAKLTSRICLIGPMNGTLSEQLDVELSSSYVPSAIFATSDLLSIQILRELQRRSLRIPEKIALISFDDFDAATLVRPTITVVQQPIAELGRRAASQLLSRMESQEALECSPLVLPTELILRESCGCGKRTKARKAQ